MAEGSTYKLKATRSGREYLSDRVDGEHIYVDPVTKEDMEVVAVELPSGGSSSKLPRIPENLRICGHCEQMAGRDLSDCPYCNRRL